MEISAEELAKYFQVSCDYLKPFTKAPNPDFRFEGFESDAAGTHVSIIISFLRQRPQDENLMGLAIILKYERSYQKIVLNKQHQVIKIEPYKR